MPPKPRLADRATLVSDAAFNARVAMAAVTVALEVVAEDSDTEHHELRVMLAVATLADPLSQGKRMSAVALADDTFATGATAQASNIDEVLPQRLRAVWNAMSGVHT